MEDLPGELELEVLARLPVREFLRLRHVCKAWRDAATDPLFIRSSQTLHTGTWPDDTALLFSASENGALSRLINPEHSNASWVPFPGKSRDTLVAAAGGLLCFQIATANAWERNYVVCNPITKQAIRLPTLHLKPNWSGVKPKVVMVVRDGRFHQLWVDMRLAVCVYDCFINKSTMERRIANSGKHIFPLPSLWMEFFFQPTICRKKFMYYDSKILFANDCENIVAVDVDDFSVVESTRDCPLRDVDGWLLDTSSLFESTGRLFSCWMVNGWEGLAVCLVTFVRSPSAGGIISRHEPVFRINQEIPSCTILGFYDSCLISRRVKDDDDDTSCCLDLMFHKVLTTGSSSSSSSWRERCLEDATRIQSNRTAGRKLHRLELSLTDSPGSEAGEGRNFDWDMVSFPEENKKLEARWYKRTPWDEDEEDEEDEADEEDW